MAAPAIAVPLRRDDAAPAWIIGRASDLTFLIGGALVAYAFLVAHVVFGVAAVTIYMLWVLAIDGPHVFATLSRTYLDDRERAARGALMRWSLCFFALGPASVAGSAAVGARLPYDLFLTFCTGWAYWHVVRQHYGDLVFNFVIKDSIRFAESPLASASILQYAANSDGAQAYRKLADAVMGSNHR